MANLLGDGFRLGVHVVDEAWHLFFEQQEEQFDKFNAESTLIYGFEHFKFNITTVLIRSLFIPTVG